MTELEQQAELTESAARESEHVLIQRARSGDEEAFTQLARHFARPIRRWALVLTGDSDDADDVLQEVLIRLYRRLERFEGRARLATWLYRVTRNLALSVLRTRRRRDRRLAMRSLDAFARVGDQGDRLARLVESESAEIVRTFFSHLTEQQRMVFTMVDIDGRSSEEVAELLGVAASTVRVHLLRARRTLRRRILAAHPAFREDA